MDREELIQQAEDRLQRVRDQLLLREKRFREYGDYQILQTWLLHVRGITLKEPLKMVTPPLVPMMYACFSFFLITCIIKMVITGFIRNFINF